jgi:hypothetical protein
MATIEDINNMYLGLTGTSGNPQIIGYLSDAINNGRMTLGDVRAMIAPQQAMPAGLLGPAPQQAPQINPEIANAFMQSLLYQSQLPGMSRLQNPTAVNPLNIPPTPSPYRINWPSINSSASASQPVDGYSSWNYYDNEGNPIPKPTTTKK